MKNSKQFLCYFVIIVLTNFVITNISFAQTHIPYGDVSGTWTIDGSPYIIDGHINVPVDSALVIEPGVNVIFSDQYYFRIYGKLLSEGILNDTINFTVQDTTNDYAGLYFYDTDISIQDSSKVEYCKFDPGCVGFFNSSNIILANSVVTNGAGVFCSEASPTLIDITISNNTTDYYGGGIYCTDSSNPSLVNVTISGNSATWGGGISCIYNSNPTLENVNIINNNAIGVGGGIFCEESSSPILNNVTISGNEGGGIACYDNSNPILANVIISNNSVWGGLYFNNSSPILSNVVISGNSTIGSGGGICGWVNDGNITLEDVIIIGNSALSDGGGIQVCGDETNLNLVNVLIANNYAENCGGGINAINGPSLNITNVTFSGNSTEGLGGGIMCQLGCNLIMRNSIVWNNPGGEIVEYGPGNEVTINYSDICGGWFGQGSNNIDTDPLFADTLYHLSEYSPCIDAGNPDTMYYDVEDPNNPGFALYPAMGTIINDMGAYGGHGNYEPPVTVDDEQIPNHNSIQLNNYPNPFTNSTTISFNISRKEAKTAKIEIYNIKGQKIKQYSIFNSQSSIQWDGKNENNKPVSNGIYFYILETDKQKSKVKKMLFIR
ncbi:MAG: right-handed parallel beta-helix repeat-containing protein [Candidatus Cloacimonadota bacterium]|nr:right-handed parallel beta-helix repeat-containing protein [Candidatus Cloacimonadota bacterium]